MARRSISGTRFLQMLEQIVTEGVLSVDESEPIVCARVRQEPTLSSARNRFRQQPRENILHGTRSGSAILWQAHQRNHDHHCKCGYEAQAALLPEHDQPDDDEIATDNPERNDVNSEESHHGIMRKRLGRPWLPSEFRACLRWRQGRHLGCALPQYITHATGFSL
jgi:hypothetical protein